MKAFGNILKDITNTKQNKSGQINASMNLHNKSVMTTLHRQNKVKILNSQIVKKVDLF